MTETVNYDAPPTITKMMQSDASKTCSRCGGNKPVMEFSRDLQKRDGLTSWCKSCSSESYRANRGKKQAKNKIWAAANRDKCRISEARYRAANRGKCRAASAAHHAAHPEQYRAKWAAYEATKLQATPAWASKGKIGEFYYTADMLGMHTGDPYHVDHVVPLRSKLVCGLHCEFNMQVLTGVDNLKKGNRYWPDMP